ncbi:Ig-like domain-containing protein [Loktanella sp. DJP18]|uniref:Ig-like domain-containing protein n=1 Tax=Loktanella sp. DJP18 TaxID=3409788 RepID=UPI003BB778CC
MVGQVGGLRRVGQRGERRVKIGIPLLSTPNPITIDTVTFSNPGSGLAASFGIDAHYTGAGTLTLTLAFRDAGGVTLDSLTRTPFANDGTPVSFSGLEAAAENAVDVVVTVTDGTFIRTATVAVSGIDATPPYVVSYAPDDAAVDVPTTGNFVVMFDTPIFEGEGSITFGGVSVAIGACTISGAVLTIPYSGLAAATAITPAWPAGLVVDDSGNQCGVLTDEVTFMTAAEIAPTATATCTFVGNTPVASLASTHTIGNGYVTGDEFIIFATRGGGDTTPDGSMIFAGATVTRPTGTVGINGGAGMITEVFRAVLTADAPGGITIGFTDPGGSSSETLEVFKVVIPAGSTVEAVAAAKGNVSGDVALSVAIGQNGFVVAAAQSLQSSGTLTWTGLTKNSDIVGVASRKASVASGTTTIAGMLAVKLATGDSAATSVIAVSVIPT